MQSTAGDFAAEIQPRLLNHARCELRRLGLEAEDYEDLVQDAWARWLRTQPSRVEQWLRVCIHGLAIDRGRRRSGIVRGGQPDPLDMAPAGLEVLGA